MTANMNPKLFNTRDGVVVRNVNNNQTKFSTKKEKVD